MILRQGFRRHEIIDSDLINFKMAEAEASERKRVAHVFTTPSDIPQILLNACMTETYLRPHIHGLDGNPKKAEKFKVLKGTIGVLEFDDLGNVINRIILSSKDEGVFISPETWHSYVVLLPAVVYGKIYGSYDPKTHKQFPLWAPEEGSPDVRDYLEKLKSNFYVTT